MDPQRGGDNIAPAGTLFRVHACGRDASRLGLLAAACNSGCRPFEPADGIPLAGNKQVVHRDMGARRGHDHVLDEDLQLFDVPRPRIRQQPCHGFIVRSVNVPIEFFNRFFEKVIYKQRDVFGSFTQSRQSDDPLGQHVREVRREIVFWTRVSGSIVEVETIRNREAPREPAWDSRSK